MTNKTELPIDVNRIMKMIPHRYPFLLVDRIVECEPGVSAVGLKNVTINEPHFQGHFPQLPIMPGVLIIEAMAQTAALLVVEKYGEEGEGKIVYFMGIDSAKFRKPVVPGDSLYIHVHTTQSRANVWKFRAEAKVNDVVVAEASFGAMISSNK